ncbi:MAG: sigma 54-interacting transcriptional regulator [Acidobacteria bacterium]|nr:sigma 54-interacting transcriptional regulator [Acidobacteriota bacterium]
MIPERHFSSDTDLRRYEALQQMTDVIVRHHTLPELFQDAAERLCCCAGFDFANFSLYDPARDVMVRYFGKELESKGLAREAGVDESLSGRVWREQTPQLYLDLQDIAVPPPGMAAIRECGVRTYCIVPMSTTQKKLGALALGSLRPRNCGPADLRFLGQLADLMALAVENVLTHESLRREKERLSILLDVSTLLSRSKDSLRRVFPEISACLAKAVPHDAAVLNLVDKVKQQASVYAVTGVLFPDFLQVGMTVPLQESVTGRLLEGEARILGRSAMEQLATSPAMRRALGEGFQSLCFVPLTSPRGVWGAFGLGSKQENAFSEADLDVLHRVASELARAVEGDLAQAALQEEQDRLRLLLEVNAALVPNLDLPHSFLAISEYLCKVVAQDFACLCLYDEADQKMRVYAISDPFSVGIAELGATYPIKGSLSGQALLESKVKVYEQAQFADFSDVVEQHLTKHGIESVCCLPLITRNGPVGTLSLASRQTGAFAQKNLGLLQQIASQIAVALDNHRAYAEIAELKDKLTEQKLYLEEEIQSELKFEEIVGESPVLSSVLTQTKIVAPSDATVLVLGETGTGKELIARAIHRMSSRKDASFIKLNCAAIPTGLLESELFGHERGAFTGAISQKIGRLELANHGTLFLDEIGEIPLELQPKLLRVLQDQEFERLGSTRTLKVDIRLIAATNRDLQQSVAHREFRSDLYYRLNVFPIHLPSLRERKTDIPLLVRYFVHMYRRRLKKEIETVPEEVMEALLAWHWPGNIRELENFIERSVILSSGKILHAPLAELRQKSPDTIHGTLESMQREHIVRILRETRGVIAGLHGAAARLGLKRTTLQSRIQRMGISREEYLD